MFELLPALIPILLVDALNPVLFAMLVFAAGSSRPAINSTAMLLGHTLACFIAGIDLLLKADLAITESLGVLAVLAHSAAGA